MNSATNLVSILKSAGDSLRLDILAVLKEASFGVQELASIFEMSQPAMSHHLKVLLKSGLVETRREANSIFYKRSLTQRESADFIRDHFTFGIEGLRPNLYHGDSLEMPEDWFDKPLEEREKILKENPDGYEPNKATDLFGIFC